MTRQPCNMDCMDLVFATDTSTQNGPVRTLAHQRNLVSIPWDPCMIYMATWIPSIYPSHVSIYTSTMDPIGLVLEAGFSVWGMPSSQA